jgi:Domain of unknown function (DUF929)
VVTETSPDDTPPRSATDHDPNGDADSGTPVGPPDSQGPSPQGPSPRDPPGHHPRNRTARFAWSAIALILIAVIALVVYALTSSDAPGVVRRATTSAGVVADLSRIPPSVFNTVGVSAPMTPLVTPAVLKSQPPLSSGGKPEVLFVGAEFCPFCAAERWPLIVALSRFGHFITLTNMQSASLSVFPSIQTFSFVGTSYSSPFITFTGVELYSDVANAQGAFTRIDTLSSAQSSALNHYGTVTATEGSSGSYPFVDIGNTLVTSTSGYSPAVIVGQSQSAIAGGLDEAGNPITQAIVASANYLTAGICSVTHGQPVAVCASKGVRAAGVALALS